MKGILLAGGTASRFYPASLAVSKQLAPVYDKPAVYYPLSTLMLAGVRDILLISGPDTQVQFQRLLGDGSSLGLDIRYAIQPEPRGLAQALTIGAGHIGDDTVALALGDNLHHGHGLSELLQRNARSVHGCVLFGVEVDDPENFGVVELDDSGMALSIEEKPAVPRSNQAVTGLYFYDNEAVGIAEKVRPSARGELEITAVNREYLSRGTARVVRLGPGFGWLDLGTPEGVLEAAQYVHVMASRHRTQVGCVEEVALRMGLIDAAACYRLGEAMRNSAYGRYVMETASCAGYVTG